jgi:hypothetical protein
VDKMVAVSEEWIAISILRLVEMVIQTKKISAFYEINLIEFQSNHPNGNSTEIRFQNFRLSNATLFV